MCNDLSLWIRLRGLMVNRRHFSSNIRLVFSSDSKKRSKEIYVAAICAMRRVRSTHSSRIRSLLQLWDHSLCSKYFWIGEWGRGIAGRGTIAAIIASVGSVVLVPQNVPQHPVTPSCSEFESRRRQLHRSDMQKNIVERLATSDPLTITHYMHIDITNTLTEGVVRLREAL